jgi:HAD superfamily hydrolase (TIGR01549 family)
MIMSKKDKKKVSKRLLKRQKEVGTPAIVFNFDGTVMNTGPANIASYRHVFAKYHKAAEFTPDLQQEVVGQPIVEMMKRFFPDRLEEAVEEYRSYQHYHLRDLIQPMPGIVDLLIWLKENNYKVGIVSSRSRDSIVNILEHHGMMNYVDVIIAHYYQHGYDTDAASLRKICQLLKKKCCIYIGDTPDDIICGHEVGAFTIAYASNRRLLYQIIEAGPDFVTADYKQVRKLIDGEPYWLAYELIPEPEEAPAEKTEVKPEEKSEEKPEEKPEENPAPSAEPEKIPEPEAPAQPKEPEKKPAPKPAKKAAPAPKAAKKPRAKTAKNPETK